MADSEKQGAVSKLDDEFREMQESQRAAFRVATEGFMDEHDELMRLLAH